MYCCILQEICNKTHAIFPTTSLIYHRTILQNIKDRNSAAYITLWHFLNVHKINKQDMQNNMHIIGVKLNAQMVLLLHIFMRRDVSATHQPRRQ